MNSTDGMGIVIDDDDGPTASAWVWTGLIFCAAVSFWFQATITEERFVPALNVVSNRFNIPHDVAGATLMAAGASSPELFSSIVALFITHTALGLGTIVGSEIFNQLMICFGSVYAARGHRLELDKAILIREVGFYALSIVLLYWALSDRRTAVDDDESGKAHIYVHFWGAFVLFATYVLYVFVCAYFEAVCKVFSKIFGGGGTEEEKAPILQASKRELTSIEVPDMEYLRQVRREPKSNFAESSGEENVVNGMSGLFHSLSKNRSGKAAVSHSDSKDSGIMSSIHQLSYAMFRVESERPSDQHELQSLELNEFEESLSCFLWQKSNFYDHAKVRKNGWHLRWFTFNHDKVMSVPNRVNHDHHVFNYPVYNKIEADRDHLLIRLSHTSYSRNYTFMAPSSKIFEAVVSKCEEILQYYNQNDSENKPEDLSENNKEDEEPPLIAYPHGASIFGLAIHFILLPFKAIMHFTVPDVRHNDSCTNVSLAVLSCLFWLIVGSYSMVASLENLADLMRIPPAVVGVTVSAAGTSLPNYVGSQCAAKQGFGNMAVSNAFGSNTFNILVGLGLPWTLYVGFVSDGPYHGLEDDDITKSVVILAIVLAAFVVTAVATKLVLYRWHANLFALMYIAYLSYVIVPFLVGK
mmetsp:Transcript_16630/g.20727  ORF Transcript_16630/g.20727 Transcript_16630/m.20727 type:complete len:639 (-) Transcript_16630:115-2031(-)|eukprot:CAMPEP_0172497768 /NCGR_PEP_ID=MMETSP1066-20121228/104809_1 /TAXON_ID=671091 /ORGANISM="Coscinodiscus wailesii, Strain CCMP2513" /LENGTH=638 /DNA_ID=CAMNT_0013270727 /DNA_START=67 /DNA_END=1983 /DNA_ORIENTATION=+